MSRHVLFLAFSFPPSRGAGVYRTVAMANALASAGWDVTVIAPEESYFRRYQQSEDQSLMDWPDPKIEIRRVPLTNHHVEQKQTKPRELPVLSSAKAKAQTRWRRFVSPLESYDFWFRPALKASMRVVRSNKPDLVLATGNPFNSFLVANLIKRRTGIPYVLDYRDAWTFDQFTGSLKPGATDVALALERRALFGAGAYISVNQAIVDRIDEIHSLPPHIAQAVIRNGYDSELISTAQSSTATPFDGHRPLRFGHVGTLIPDKLDWPDVFGEFEQASRQLDGDVELQVRGHLGFSEAQAEPMRHMFDGLTTVEHQGPLEKRDVSAFYASVDALFLPMYESPYHTSGKVYEMMSTGKPILAWGPETAGAMEPLHGYPLLVRADRGSPESSAQSMLAMQKLVESQDPDLSESAKRYAEQFERTTLLKPLVGLLEDVAGQQD